MNEAQDTLKSTSYAQVLDLIAEGEIVGLVNGAKSIYLDDTPVQNADGSYNFTSVSYVANTGTQTQPAITGFDEVDNEIAVAVEVKASTGPVVRTISNSSVTSVAVTIQLQSLSEQDSKGNINGTSVQYAIDIQTNGGGWVEKINETVTGKSMSPYERQYRIKLPAGATRQVRVRRITADSSSLLLNNKTFFKSYTEVVEAKLRYPNSAVIGIKFDSSQFKSIPARAYDVKLLKIRIPTNATVRSDGSLAYSGSWDGTFQVAWCTCPAWAYYDLLTNERYGLGNYIDAAQVDKWSLYAISKYSNELVDNGLGGSEPRFSCNLLLNTRQEAYTVIGQMTSIFRGMSYWASGSVSTVQDAPKDPTYLFANANVVDGVFNYQGSSAKSRHTVALVGWNDPADMCRSKVEYVEDTDGIARYGVIETPATAIGCTSRGQAQRVGRWLLYSERFETEVVTFRTGGEGALCEPGDVIKVQDENRAGNRTGGRISAATSTTITVDAVGTPPSGTKTLYVLGPDGVTQTRTVASISGNVITVTAALSPVPAAEYVWAMSGSGNEVQTFRVLSVVEADSGEHEVVALEHYPEKYPLVESNLVLTDPQYTTLSPVPTAPTSLTLAENTYAWQNTTRSKITATWALADYVTSYVVQWRVDDGNFDSVTVYTNSYELLDTIIGTYEVRVYAVNAQGVQSGEYATASITTVGNSAAPTAVSDLTATSIVGGARLQWSSAVDALWQTEIYENTSNNSATATLIATVAANTYNRTGLTNADGVRYYWVKLVNTQGVKSGFSNVASATATAVGSGLVLTLSKYAVNLPAYADGNVLTFSDAFGQVTVYSGGVDVTASSTLSATATGCTGTVNTAADTPVSGQAKGFYRVTALTAGVNTATLEIAATYNGQTIKETFTANRVVQGIEIVSSLPYSNLFYGRIVYLTTTQKLYRYTVEGWTAATPTSDLTGQITSTQITDGAISTPKLATNSVTTSALAANAVTTDKIYAGAITAAKLATTELISTSAQLGNAVVDTIKIAGNAITIPVLYQGYTQTITYAAGIVTVLEMPSYLTVGDASSGGVIAVYYATFDGRFALDAGQRIDIYADYNDGSGYQAVGYQLVGTPTSSGDTYPCIPIAMAVSASGVSQVKFRVTVQVVNLGTGGTYNSSTHQNPRLSVMGAKR